MRVSKSEAAILATLILGGLCWLFYTAMTGSELLPIRASEGCPQQAVQK